jgi:SAM-dependent methyltransferase
MNMPAADSRSAESLRNQYAIEKELALKLRQATKAERRKLYTDVYDELFRRVPDHGQLTTKVTPEEARRRVGYQMNLLRRFIHPRLRFLEIGPGDCSLSFHLASEVREVHCVDVSDEITKCSAPPHNFRLYLSDGTSIPLPPGSIDLVYSNQLMEHLHTDDALEQLRNVHAALAAGGHYVCITPNRLTGPHDISRHFDREATCLHLHEYTTGELARIFKRVGFRQVRVAVGGRTSFIVLPPIFIAMLEGALSLLPARMRGRPLGRHRLFRVLLGIRMIGTK